MLVLLGGSILPSEVRAERPTENASESAFPSAIAVVEGVAANAFEVSAGQGESSCQSVNLVLKVHQKTLVATIAFRDRVLTVKFCEFYRCKCHCRHALPTFLRHPEPVRESERNQLKTHALVPEHTSCERLIVGGAQEMEQEGERQPRALSPDALSRPCRVSDASAT